MLRQKSRPYLFSNSLAPVIVAASIKVLDILENSNDLIHQVNQNTQYFRNEMSKLGFEIKGVYIPLCQ